jgi:hypothetical protein
MSNQLIKIFESGAKAEKKKAALPITFMANGQTHTEKAVRYDDAFFEIVGGKFNGNLVHIFDLVKK